MTLRIKNPEVEKLAVEVAALTGEDETEAVHKALVERKQRLVRGGSQGDSQEKGAEFIRLLEEEIWPSLPEGPAGRAPTREEQEELLGFGPAGV